MSYSLSETNSPPQTDLSSVRHAAKKERKTAILCILDGWGDRPPAADNAISLARTPNWSRLSTAWPRAQLDASGKAVGLPDGQMGNSEVGHMNIGAGRVVWQELVRINQAVEAGNKPESLAKMPALKSFAEKINKPGQTCHLFGLLSPGGVHSHQKHIEALAKILSDFGLRVAVHAALDGRDTPPRSAHDYVAEFESNLKKYPGVSIATLTGRYFGMDRNNNWPRVTKAYDAMVEAIGTRFVRATDAIDQAYARGETDEFVTPYVHEWYHGMKDGDGLMVANFRADRVRQLLDALLDPNFSEFLRRRVVKFGASLAMTSYSDSLNALIPPLFPPIDLTESLGEVVAKSGRQQLRLAETEKYPHVTFFFNGGRETPFEGEDRILVPSPSVKTYDLKPEMSAFEICDQLCAAIRGGKYDLIIINFANGDMVGHTGELGAAVKAVEAVDKCLGMVEQAVLDADASMIVTADHGNVEQMRDPITGEPHTAHTTNLVPVVLVNGPKSVSTLHSGKLSDLAPTLLKLLDMTPPAAMTGKTLYD